MDSEINEMIEPLKTVLFDDLDKIEDLDLEKINYSFEKINPLLISIYYLLKGRYNIETSWDYNTTYVYYKKALSYAQSYIKNDELLIQKKILDFLIEIIKGHIKLEEAEADWTLCNFDNAYKLYLEASDYFKNGAEISSGKINEKELKEIFILMTKYAEGWQKLTSGMHFRMFVIKKLKEKTNEKIEQFFLKANQEFEDAIDIFSNYGNKLGARDAESYIMDGQLWKKENIISFAPIEVRWLDFFQIFSEGDYFKQLSQIFPNIRTISPSELIANNRIKDHFKTLKIKIGKIRIVDIGERTLNDIEINMHFFTQKSGMIEYHYKSSEKIDIFLLYLLKILNSNAVPTYKLFLDIITNNGKRTYEYNTRIHELSKKILSEFFPFKKLTCNIDSQYTIITIFNTSSGKIDEKMIQNYPYLKTILSTTEMAIWKSPREFLDLELNNLAKGVFPNNMFIFSSGNSIFIFATIIPIWETKLCNDLIVNLLLLKNEILYFQRHAEDRIKYSQSSLKKLKIQISSEKKIQKDEIISLMTKNIELRNEEIKIVELIELYRSFCNAPINELTSLIERLANLFNFNYFITEMDSNIKKLEKLYETSYHIGQEYLSLMIMINSDISTRIFTALSIIMFGSLGLSILTATLKTPIAYSIASFGVCGTAFLAYLYFLYIKIKTLGVKSHFLSNK